MRTKLRSKLMLLFMSLAMVLAVPAVALADIVHDQVNGIDNNANESLSLAVNETKTVKYWIERENGDGEGSCNVDDGEQLYIKITSGSPAVANAVAGQADVKELTVGGVTGLYIGPFTQCDIPGTSDREGVLSADIKGLSAGAANFSVSVPPNGSTGTDANGATVQLNNTGNGTYNTTTDGTFTANVTAPPNTAPVANNDNYNTPEDTPLNVPAPGVLGNDTDADSNPLTAALGTSPSHGELTLNANGSFTYTPDVNFHGSDSFTYRANDGTANSNTATVTINVAAVNDPPVISSVSNNGPINEGSSATITVNATDVDNPASELRYSFDCDNNAIFEKGPNDANSDSCSFDDNGSHRVNVRVTDGAGGSATGFTNVQVNNVAPTATKSFDSSTDEGSNFNLALTNPSDPSSVDTSAGFSYAFDCGTGYGAFGSSSSTVCSTNDNGMRNVGAKIRDRDGGVTEYTDTVTVNNVAPEVTNISASSQNVLAGKNITFTGTATDVSSVDQAAGFSWKWAIGQGAFGNYGLLGNNQFTTNFADCGSQSVRAIAKDKDGGESAAVSSPSVNVYNASYNAPLNEGMQNLVQAGRVIPVKISVGCASNLTGLTPSIQMLKGLQNGAENTDGTDNVETLSTSAADTTGVMRPVDGGYIYNLQVPSTAKANDLYTVRVNPFGGNNASSNMYVVLKIRK